MYAILNNNYILKKKIFQIFLKLETLHFFFTGVDILVIFFFSGQNNYPVENYLLFKKKQ